MFATRVENGFYFPRGEITNRFNRARPSAQHSAQPSAQPLSNVQNYLLGPRFQGRPKGPRPNPGLGPRLKGSARITTTISTSVFYLSGSALLYITLRVVTNLILHYRFLLCLLLISIQVVDRLLNPSTLRPALPLYLVKDYNNN